MATVNRPPFWVPRPPDDNIWALQLQRSQALTLSTTELKWYGAPGQVPTKRWLPHLLYDDPGVAYYPRIEWMNSGAIQLTNTQVKIYGQHGQVPTKNWSQQLTYDDPPPWQFPVNWMDSAAIELLTHQRFFGAGGQVPAKLWSPYLWDDPSPVWQIESNWMNSAAIQQLTSQKIFGQGGQVPPARWNFNYDETGPWQWTVQERNPNLLTVSAAQNPFTPIPWRFNYDETPPWAAQPVATNIEFMPTNVPRAAFYALKPGEEHFWQPAIERNANLLPPVTQNPFIPVSWRFNYDETPLWLGKPVATNVNFIPFLIPSFALWIDDVDDPPTWQWAYHRNLNINTGTTAAVPGVSRIWTFRTDPDDVGWIGQPVAANINFIPVNVPRAAFYALRAGDEQVWAAAPRAVSPAQFPSLPPVNVLNVYRWWFNYDQDPMWQGQPLPGLIVNVPIPPVVGPGVYNTMLLCIPNGMFMIPGNPPS